MADMEVKGVLFLWQPVLIFFYPCGLTNTIKNTQVSKMQASNEFVTKCLLMLPLNSCQDRSFFASVHTRPTKIHGLLKYTASILHFTPKHSGLVLTNALQCFH